MLRGQVEERRAPEAEIEEQRRLTFAIAYRMTGSVSDAEDIGQEAFLRLERARRDGEPVDSPRAWLSTVTTRLAIDHMRSARAQARELRRALAARAAAHRGRPGPGRAGRGGGHGLAGLPRRPRGALAGRTRGLPAPRGVRLRLSPGGRGGRQGRGELPADRAARPKHVEAREARFEADRDHGEELLDRFLEASESGDVEALKEILAADAVVYWDGGGKVAAARHPFSGADRIARFMVKVTSLRRAHGASASAGSSSTAQPGRMLIGARRPGHRRPHDRGRRRPHPHDPHRPQPGQASTPAGLIRLCHSPPRSGASGGNAIVVPG